MILVTHAVALLLGLLLGAVLMVRWYTARARNPEVARAMLQTLYQRAHGHWLARSRHDPTPVCPCCGWSEAEARALRTTPPDRPAPPPRGGREPS